MITITIKEVKKRIEDYSFYTYRENIKIYLVGGAVRDTIMGKKINDQDYCITGLDQNEFEKLFPEAELVGESFPVYLMRIEGQDEKGTEFALARKERKTGEGHKGFETTTNRDITIEDDLSRRDLTINAMAMDLETGKIIDPFNGKKDIKEGVIRATSEAFKEDPLRVYRAARFAARYGFIVDTETIKMMQSLKNELGTISGERVTMELEKVLKEENPSTFFKVLDEAGVLVPEYLVKGEKVEGHFKEFVKLKEKDERKFKALMTMLDNDSSSKNIERFSILFHFFNEEQIDNICAMLKMPNDYGLLAKFLNENFSKIGGLNRLPDSEIVKIISELLKNPLTKQAENTNPKDSLEWFESGMNALNKAKGNNPAVKFQVKRIKEMALEIKNVKITKEEIEANGLKGPEIGRYLNQKRVNKYKELTSQKQKGKEMEL